MNKIIFWAIITLAIAITGIVFLAIFLFAIIDEAFWAEVILFGWDHYYTFIIVMAVVFLGLTGIIYIFVFRKLKPLP